MMSLLMKILKMCSTMLLMITMIMGDESPLDDFSCLLFDDTLLVMS